MIRGPMFAGQAADLATWGNWSMSTPLRAEFERRAALVEIDALSALMLGLSVKATASSALTLMFRTQLPVLRRYTSTRCTSIEQATRSQRTIKRRVFLFGGQQGDDYKLLQAYFDGGDYKDLLDRYEPFQPDGQHGEPWFYKPDREAEMRAAYADSNGTCRRRERPDLPVASRRGDSGLDRRVLCSTTLSLSPMKPHAAHSRNFFGTRIRRLSAAPT